MNAPLRRWLPRAAFVLGLAGALLSGWCLLPRILYSREVQPAAFDHLLHVEDGGMSCEDCHAFRDDGSFTGVPSVTTCADCHAELLGESEAERRLVEDYVEPGREIGWLVLSRQPENVYFSHAAHVRLGGIGCERCHGPHGTSTTAPDLETNRISTYSRAIWGPRIRGGGDEPWESMKMSDCSDCHAEHGVRDHCLMCHK